MREGGDLVAESLEDDDLPGSVRKVVITPDDMGDLHGDVVDHRREVIGGRSVRADDHEVVERVGREGHRSSDGVVEHDIAPGLRHRDTPYVGLTRGDARRGRGRAERAAGPVIPGGTAGRPGCVSLRGEFLGGTEARVDRPGLPQLSEGPVVQRSACGLEVRPVGPTRLGTLIPVQSEPAQRADDGGGVLGSRTLWVGVVDPQHERATRAAGERPVVDGRPRSSDVQVARRARREADADRLVHGLPLSHAAGKGSLGDVGGVLVGTT